MKILKNILTTLSVIVLTVATSGLTSALSPVTDTFYDVPYNSFYTDALSWAVAEGVVDDRPMFYPAIDVKRAGMAKMIVEAMGVPLDTTGGPSFIDVPYNEWYYAYVETGAAYGVITGYSDYTGAPSGYFGPANNPTRAEALAAIMRAFGFDSGEMCERTFPDVDYGSWYAPYVDSACAYGIVTGDGFGRMRPSDTINRAEFITMLNRAATYETVDTPSAPTTPTTETGCNDAFAICAPTEPVDGEATLMVSVAPSTPVPSVIPADAAAVNYATFAFSALGDDARLERVSAWRNGLGSRDDFEEVWLSVDGFMAGSTRSVNSDGFANLNLGSDYIIIPEGETILVDVKASMSSSVGANIQNRLGFRSAADIGTDADVVTGSFPMYGNYMTTSSYQVGSVEFSNDGSATNVDVGDVQTSIGEFRVENNSASNEDFVLSAMDLEINGSGTFRDIANASIYYLGERVSNVVTPLDDHLRFTFNDGGFILRDGDTDDFEVRADIIGGEDSDTIQLQMDDDSDFTVYVANSSRNYAVDVNRTNPSNGTLSIYTINAGDITFARHSSSPSATNLPPDTNGVSFLTAQVTVGDDVFVEESRVYLDASLNTGSDGSTAITSVECASTSSLTQIIKDKFDNVKIWNGARFAAGSENTLSSLSAGTFAGGTCTVSNAYYTFNDSYLLSRGVNIMTLTADVSRYASAGETFSLSFDNLPSTWFTGEYYASGQEISSSDVNGSASGSVFTIESANITLARQDGFSNGENLVVGAYDTLLMTFKIEGNDTGDIHVTDIDIQDGAVDVDGTLITGLAIYEHGTMNPVTNVLNLGDDDIAQFDGLDIVIPSGGFALFDVRGSISTAWDPADDLQLFVTGIQAQDAQNNDATITYPTCRISGCSPNDAIASANFTFSGTAELNIAFNSRNDSSYSGLITPSGGCYGAACVRVAELEIHPLYDDVVLKKLILTNDDDAVDYSSRFGTFYLYDEETGTVIDTGSMSDSGGDGQVSFDGFSYSFDKDEYHDVSVYAQVQNITRVDQTGGMIKLYLNDVSTDVQAVSGAIGQDVSSSSINNTALTSDARIQTYVARRTIPTITYNNSDKIITSSMTNFEVYEFTMTADQNGNLEWQRITFDVSETAGITSTDYKLYVKGQSNALNSSGASVSGGEVVITPDTLQQVNSAGTTYVLKANLTLSSSSPQTLGLTLTADADTTLTTDIQAALSGADFVWSDKSALSHSSSTADWTNGYEVESFDISTVNIGFAGN